MPNKTAPPYKREGADKISDTTTAAPSSTSIAPARPVTTGPRTNSANASSPTRAAPTTCATSPWITDVKTVGTNNIPAAQLKQVHDFQRKAQFYLDFVEAENSMGFHAPQEAVRILGESINFSRKGQNALRALPKPAAASATITEQPSSAFAANPNN